MRFTTRRALTLCAVIAVSLHASGRLFATEIEPVVELLKLLQAGPSGSSSTSSRLDDFERPPETSYKWPIDVFLRGEVHLMRGELEEAKVEYKKLVDWSAEDPYQDGSGGSGLVAIALWRLLQDDPQRIAKEITENKYPLIDKAKQVLESSLTSALLKPPKIRVYPDLSRFEEDIVRQLSTVAWTLKDRDSAKEFFRRFLELQTGTELTDLEKEVMKEVVNSTDIALDAMTLERGKRLAEWGYHREASKSIGQAANSQEDRVRIEARLYLSQLWRILGVSRDQIITLLDSVIDDLNQDTDKTLFQEALLERAKAHNRGESDEDISLALKDFETIVKHFPDGTLVDEALLRIARTFEWQAEVDQALDTYSKLRGLTGDGQKDRIDSAYFRPALIHYRSGNVQDGIKLLQSLEQIRPNGDLHIHSLFWLGRMYERIGQRKRAKEYFTQVVEERPFELSIDYYAIRARMHLNTNEAAKGNIFPDQKTQQSLHELYNAPSASVELSNSKTSEYLKRVDWALGNAVYTEVLKGSQQFQQAGFSRRQKSDPFYIETSGFLAPLVIRSALLWDALKADELRRSPILRSRITERFGNSGDWTGGFLVLNNWGERQGRGYLKAAYPPAFADALAESAGKHNVAPEILYALMRKESWFAPTAHSPMGALGLFQFIPTTFFELDREWNLLENTQNTIETYLTNPQLSIELAGRWVNKLLSRHDGDALLAIMEHNAGSTAINRWKQEWNDGWSRDVEYRVEAAHYGQTRIFVRDVLAGVAVAKASHLFHQSEE